MQVAVRVDASARIGAGHVVRCLALAQTLRTHGARVHFVCRELTAGTRAQIESRDFEVTLLQESKTAQSEEQSSRNLLPTDQAEDSAEVLMALSGAEWDWIIVDHYRLDAQWESNIRRAARRILVIDDMADRPHDCDILLDQNLMPEMSGRYAGLVPQSAQQLLGPSYALLRPEFRELRPYAQPRKGPLSRLLVLFGGTDPRDLTGRALAAVAGLKQHRLEVDVVIGLEHPQRHELEAWCMGSEYRLHVQVEAIAKLMQAADLAIGASGSSSWERCCLGLPAICVPFADNQRPIAKALHDFGACLCLGYEPFVGVSDIAGAVSEMISDRERYRRMSRLAYSLVDGEGAARVCDAMSG